MESSTIRNNQALGGSGDLDASARAGVGQGGGLCVAGGTATLRNTSVTGNTAKGGNYSYTYYSDPFDPHPLHHDGFIVKGNLPGYGGGLYIAPAALAYLDAFTVAQVTRNQADNDRNISGSYTLVS